MRFLCAVLLASTFIAGPSVAAINPGNIVEIGTTAQLAAGKWGQYQHIRTIGYTTINDGGGGNFYNDGTTCTPNIVSCFHGADGTYWHLTNVQNGCNVLQAGADSTGVANATTAFNAVRDNCGGAVLVPAGRFALDDFRLKSSTSVIGIGGWSGNAQSSVLYQYDRTQPVLDLYAVTSTSVLGATVSGIAVVGHQTSGTADSFASCVILQGTSPGFIEDFNLNFQEIDSCYTALQISDGGVGESYNGEISLTAFGSLSTAVVINSALSIHWPHLELMNSGNGKMIVAASAGINTFDSISGNGVVEFSGGGYTKIGMLYVESIYCPISGCGGNNGVLRADVTGTFDIGTFVGSLITNAGTPATPVAVYIGAGANFTIGNMDFDSGGTYPSGMTSYDIDLASGAHGIIGNVNEGTPQYSYEAFNSAATRANVTIVGGNCAAFAPQECPTNTALSGTFILNGATPVTVSNALVTATSKINMTLKTVGGTVGAAPSIRTITAGTGFTVAGTASDTSTFNYAIGN